MRSFSLPRKHSVILAAALLLFIGVSTALSGSSAKDKSAKGAPSSREAPSSIEATSSSEVSRASDADVIITQAQSTESDSQILPGGDTRSSRLKAITERWNTNWERRTIELYELRHGGPPRDGIPPIDDPAHVSADEAEAWLEGNEPVVAFIRGTDARAYPLQILIWHEIINDRVGGDPVLITFCPLCNSSIVFDRRVGDQVYEFGTSGLLRNSDLVMYDRTTESLWQQLTGTGIVGEHAGDRLTFLPSSIVSFDDFSEAYPDGKILSRETGYSRTYGWNPYVGYDRIGDSPFLFTGEIDGRLTAMERVVAVTLNIKGREVNVAYPFTTLASKQVINDVQSGVHLVAFHEEGTSSALDSQKISDGRDIGATGVFRPEVNGEVLFFTAKNREIVDENTGSTWDIFGRAVNGPLRGAQLEPVIHGNHFWFAWAAFKPDTIVYRGGIA
jgi:hypothetical protein